jgi:hypothetical protein
MNTVDDPADSVNAIRPESWTYRSSRIVLLALVMCFVLQVFSPLRLNTDAIILLSMAESAAQGHGFLDRGQTTVHPPGYPALVALLLRTNLGHSWAIVGLNVIFLVMGLFATYQVLLIGFFKNKTLILNICSMFLLSFVVIKHVTLPLTEILFFCCSTCALAAMGYASASRGQRFLVLVAASWVLTVGSIAVRRIGVALIPAFLYMVFTNPRVKTLLMDVSARTKVIAAALLFGVCAGTIGVIATTSTLIDFTNVVNKSEMSHTFLQIVSYRLAEFGELMVNVPMSKLPTMLRHFVPWVGCLLFSLILGGLSTRRRHIGSAEVFLGSYIGVLFVWPFYDVRFWLPVVPLLIAYSVLSVQRLFGFRLPKAFIVIYCSLFVLTGVASIAYTTRITFAGSRFPDRYGDGALRPAYCVAFQSCSDSVDGSKADPKILHLLQTYK